MRDDCIRAVTEAAARIGRTLTAQDLAGIEGRIKDAQRQLARQNRDAYRAMTPAEQVAAAGERVAKDVEAAYRLKAANIAAQIIAHDLGQGFVNAQAGKGMRRTEAVARIVMNYLDGRSGFRTMESVRTGVINYAIGQLQDIAEATQQYAGFWTNKAMVRDIVRELFGKDTGNAKAKEVAQQWQAVAGSLRKQFNELGGAIRELPGWAVPQTHAAWKVARATVEDYVNFVLPRLNRSLYVRLDGELMSDTEMRALIAQSKRTIETDGASDLVSTQGKGSIRNRGQDPRVLHFKDGDAWLEYQAKFGDRSLLENMIWHIGHMGSNIAALKTFGPNAEAGLRALLDDAIRRDAAAGAPQRENFWSVFGLREPSSKKIRAKTEIAFALASGKMGFGGDPGVAHAFQVARSILSADRLGSASLSAITDSSNGIAMARAWNLPAYRAWAKWESKAWADPKFRRMMRGQGFGVEAIAHSVSRFGEDVFGHGLSSKLANTVFRLSGLNFEDNARRIGANSVILDAIGRLAREHESMDTAHPDDVSRIKDAGVSDKTWKIWREAALDAGDDQLLTPAHIAQLANHSEAVRLDAIQELVGLAAREAETVVPMPTLKARASIEYQIGSARGTVMGEIARSVLQFKSFPIAMISNHWQRMQSMPTGIGKAAYVAELIATSTILGAISLQLKSMAFGEKPKKLEQMADAKFAAKAFVQGGAAGLYGDMIAGLTGVSPHGGDLFDQLGPLAQTGNDAYKLAGEVWREGTGDMEKRANVGADTVKFIRGNTPFANLWWGKAALDHLIFQRLQDYYSPGYAQRMRQRVEKEGNGLWWNPSTAASPGEVLTSTKGVTLPGE